VAELPTDARFLGIQDLDELATLLRTSLGTFRRLYAATLYTTFSLPKRSGGRRLINKPKPDLHRLQRRLSNILNVHYRPRDSEHGFLRSRNIITNAQPHVHRRYVFNVDLQDFFPSINFGRVRGLFMAAPFRFPPNVATVVATICCAKNELPQGAPTSPIVSNLIAAPMDRALERLAHRFRCRYTRYADDLTFSTNRPRFPEALGRMGDHGAQVGAELRSVIEGNGFKVNDRKVRLSERGQRQEVTGIIVNRDMRVPAAFISQVRSMLRAWEQFGFDRAQEEHWARYTRRPWRPKPPDFMEVVRGKIAHVGLVRTTSDPLYLELATTFADLAGIAPPLRPEKLPPRAVTTLQPAMWVVESSEYLIQGTAFGLHGVGILTCAHVLKSDSLLFRPGQADAPLAYEVVFVDSGLDVALLRPLHATVGDLVASTSPGLQQTDSVMVAGFPNYELRDTLVLNMGAVSGFRTTAAGHRRILLNARVIAGMSGGPVVDARFRVVGMAVTGAESDAAADDTEKHGAIPIDLILERATTQGKD
jgi:RNA-directed DNA polymerase